ncbi:MAG: GvpL/GvpF family gas vesicle protein [Chloroflexaceae bacterium]
MPITELAGSNTAPQGYYVYGITDGAPEALAPGVGPGAPVEVLVVGELGAIISPVPLAAFTPEAVRARQDDLAWLANQVRLHQEVLARALSQATVVPLRFGTVFRDAEGVRAMVREHAARFREALTYLAGRQEWGLSISVDRARLAEHVATASPRLQHLAARQREVRSGAAYMLAKQRDQIVREEVDRAIESCVRDVHARLAAEAVATVAGGATFGSASSGTEPVFRSAYLLEASNVTTFLALLDDLAATRSAFSFTVNGPWPAYTFVNLTMEQAHA